MKQIPENAPPSMLINELSKLFNDRMRQRTEALGFAPGYRRLLFHLHRGDALSQLELVKRTHLSAPTVSVALRQMESDGLVIRENDPEDLRTVLVRLTEAGHAADRQVVHAIQETESEMLRGIPQEELRQIRPTLEKMARNLMKGEPEK